MSSVAQAETLRLAFWDISLTRKGPGLLLRDIHKGTDAQIGAARDIIEEVAPDVLVLTGFDTDAEGRTLFAFADMFEMRFPHRFTQVGNEGRATGVDMDGDGLSGTARDTQGYGNFSGNAGMAVLATEPYPLTLEQDFTELLWRDLPDNALQDDTLPDGVAEIQRLSSAGHWVVRAGSMQLLVHAGTPPVFDGPEDRNGRRNHDETALWLHVLDGALGTPVKEPFVIAAKANADPLDGDGRPEAIAALLAHPRLQDPKPISQGAADEATPDHRGDPALDTANWDDPDPGNLRVDYILPSKSFEVLDAGVMWPADGSPAAQVSRHGLVWVDLRASKP